MLLPDMGRGRPAKAAPAVSTATTRTGDVHLTALDDIAQHIDGAFVVVVEVTAGTYRRRCFLTARSAEKAARRATERGETATVYLAELRPLWKLRGET